MNTTKPMTVAQQDRQDARDRAGRYTEVARCERCGKNPRDRKNDEPYYSDDRCRETGKGWVLCRRCADRLAVLDDAAFLAAFPQ